ncbi:M28 family metallopeptidase [Streptomyces hirsutus]
MTVNLEIRTFSETRRTHNVIAETKGGKADNVVMFGAHLDSVADGPGINDNGSGSAGILDVALNLAHEKTKNKVRFAWWSAEEFGLLGSEAYVNGLSAADRAKVKLYLNFDMIASPNHAQFVYDGDDSDQVGAGPGPEGSAQLERQITDYLDSRRTPYEGTDFTGRSDYGPFIEVGIPSGGTFTGAEGVKTAEQAKRYGGKAGVAYDACYHAACDNLKNISMKAFDVNVDVIANAVGQYAWDTSLLSKPVAPRNTKGSAGSGGGLHEGHDHEVTE